MLADIDSACTAAGVWPYAEFSGHAHNYQRYTRTVNDADSIYGGRVRRAFATFADAATYRTAYKIDVTLMLENYDTTDYGYLRVIVNATTMRDRVSSAA